MANFGTIIRPRFIALDSSHLAGLVRDKNSDEPERRKHAAELSPIFESGDNVLLITWHHLQELLSHENQQTIDQRIAFIASLPLVASVTSLIDQSLPGSVIDIDAREIAAAYHDPGASLKRVRDTAAGGMFKLGAGRDLIRPLLDSWTHVAKALETQGARTREVVAISRSGFAGGENQKIVDLLKQPARSPEDARRQFAILNARLANDIRLRGDKRIANANHTSSEFLAEVADLSRDVYREPNPVLGILQIMGIELADIGPETTVADVGRLATFRGKLEVINRSLGFPPEDLKKRVSPECLPASAVRDAVDRFRPDTAEWKGSDLWDGYLASLAAYADVTFVDKRTYEALRQAKQKVPLIRPILGRVEKARDYRMAMARLIHTD